MLSDAVEVVEVYVDLDRAFLRAMPLAEISAIR
jgi:hypothetical protein